MRSNARQAVREVGPPYIARTLGITTGAVYAWLHRQVSPRFGVAQKLLSLLNASDRNRQGPVTLEDLMGADETTTTMESTK